MLNVSQHIVLLYIHLQNILYIVHIYINTFKVLHICSLFVRFITVCLLVQKLCLPINTLQIFDKSLAGLFKSCFQKCFSFQIWHLKFLYFTKYHSMLQIKLTTWCSSFVNLFLQQPLVTVHVTQVPESKVVMFVCLDPDGWCRLHTPPSLPWLVRWGRTDREVSRDVSYGCCICCVSTCKEVV